MTIDIISIRDCIDLETDTNEQFVFVLAPFGPKRTTIYNNIIKPVVEDSGFICRRADDFKTNTNKLNDIVRNIWKSQFIIADLTGLNANVMYELGFSHAMNKQVIMIYEEKYKQRKFPFDIRYIQIIKYKSDPTGGITLKQDLEHTIDYVIGTITKSSKSDITKLFNEKEDIEFKHSVISNFEIRKKRIDYFTHYVIKNLSYFKNESYKLTDLLEECIKETKDENVRKIISKSKTMSIFNDYNFSFCQHLLNNSTNFRANAWIVNKFLDCFHVFQAALDHASNISVYSFDSSNTIYDLQEGIKYNISQLDICIEALNEERKLVYLEVFDKE